MSYQVLARKWRPANFTQMVGQEHVVQALANALDSERLHHAYLFSGTRGVGKTTIARIFAKSLNCEQGISAEPCGECSSCEEIDQGRSVDLIEIDAASRTGVDDMRELLDNVQYAPTRSRFKVYLIDEVHMLSKHSFNALLKTLEEPPPHIKFLLATTDPQKVPVTVLSRCLQFNLKRMSRAQILSQLQFLTSEEQVEADEAALAQLANAADGSMRDALSLLDQAIGYGAGAVRQEAVEAMLGSISGDYLVRLLEALAARQAGELIATARQVIANNPDYQRVCADLITLMQQLALYQADPALVADGVFDEGMLQRFATQWSRDEVQLYYQILLQGRQDLLISPDEPAGFEMLMLRLIAFAPQADEDGVKKKPELSPPVEQPPVAHRDSAVKQAPPGATGASISDVAQAESPAVSRTEPAFAPDPGSPATASANSPPGDSPAAPSTSTQRPDDTQPNLPRASAAQAEWCDSAYDLGLSGIALQLVANSELDSLDEDCCRLRLASELHDLVNDITRAEILTALQQRFGVSLRLEISATGEALEHTPLQAKQRREQQERQAAIVAIRQDATVQKLQQVFDAELDESSVVKTDSIG